MSKHSTVAVCGRDFTRLPNGVMVVSNDSGDLRAPYSKESIPDYLAQVDHSLSLKKKPYRKELLRKEEEFNKLVRQLESRRLSLIVVLQGRDGAGKTGARVRLEEALDFDARLFQAIPIGAPTEDERAHPYLWRFFAHERMPRFGQVRAFDRSWAERLLVEPVMGLIGRKELEASFAEIRTFEWLRVQQHAVLVKLWMDISKAEQKKRFEERAAEKPWKLSDSDAVAREHWDEYTRAANEMFHRTGCDFAPWYIVSSEDKRYSRVAVLEVINQALAAALK